MGHRSKRKSIMKLKASALFALMGLCVACLPDAIGAQGLVDGPTLIDDESDLLAEESQHIGLPPQRMPLPPPQGLPRLAAVPTSPIPVAVPPPPSAALASLAPSFAPLPAPFSIPKSDLSSAPSYAPRYVVPPTGPWDDRLPFEVASFRRRAAQEDDPPAEEDYQPQESKGKKSSPSVFKRLRNGIRNTGKAIVGAPSYIIKRYRKYFGGGGGGKKKGKGWKGWSSSPKQDDTTGGGWGGAGWEEYESSGFDREPSHYPADKGWKPGKGYRDYESHERRYDRESTGYKDYRDSNRDRDRGRDDYRDDRDSRPRDRPRHRERPPKYSQAYREETHYDDYDGRRTTAYYGPDRKSPPERTSERPSERVSERPPPPPEKKRPYSSSTSSSSNGGGGSSSSSNYKYDDDY